MSDQALTVIENREPMLEALPVNPLDRPTETFMMALNRRIENRKAMMAAIKDYLVADVDYGSIPLRKGSAKTKPTIFKSGGEKIASSLGLTAHYPAYHDYEQAALNGVAIELIVMRCELLDSAGRVVAEGIGARHISSDGRDPNKSVKMCSKSCFLSAILQLGFSEIFTVDLDDASPLPADTEREAPLLITPEQLTQLTSLIERLSLDPSRVEAYCKKVVLAKGLGAIKSLQDLPGSLFEVMLKKLPELAEQNKAA